MNLLLDANVGQWVLLGILVLVLVATPFFMRFKNKKEADVQQKMLDNMKKGDTILTFAGVVGKVVSFDEKEGYKVVTIETGDSKHKGYLTVDIASVYANLSNPVVPQVVAKEEAKPVEQVEQEQQPQEPTQVEDKVEPEEEKQVEQQAQENQEEKQEKPKAKKSNKKKK